jgi:hypothetical protein
LFIIDAALRNGTALTTFKPGNASPEYIASMKFKELDARIVGALNRAGITNLSQLQAVPTKELGMLPGIGKNALQTISRLIDKGELNFVVDKIGTESKSNCASQANLNLVKTHAVFQTIQRAQETVLRSAELVEEARRHRLNLAEARAQGKAKPKSI